MISTIFIPLDCYVTIFKDLKPYTLLNLSETSKAMRQTLLANVLWRERFNKDFPDSFNDGKTFFEKYTIAKRSSHFCKKPLEQKLMMLIEANYPEMENVSSELIDLLQQFSEKSDLLLTFAKPGMSFARLINEQHDPKLKDFFFKWVQEDLKEENEAEFLDYWAIAFGDHNFLLNFQQSSSSFPTKYSPGTSFNSMHRKSDKSTPLSSSSTFQKSYVPAVKHGTGESLDYLFKKLGKFEESEDLFALAIREGNLNTVKWLNGNKDFPTLSYTSDLAADLLANVMWRQDIELLSFLLEKFRFSSDVMIQAFENATNYFQWMPKVLEALLPHISKTPITINQLLYRAYPYGKTDDFSALKFLLAYGADIEYRLFEKRDNKPTMLYLACKDSNEMLVEFLLEKGADANFELGRNDFDDFRYKRKNQYGDTLWPFEVDQTPLFEAVSNPNENIVKMLLAKRAEVTNKVLEEAQKKIKYAFNAEEREKSIRILDLLKSSPS